MTKVLIAAAAAFALFAAAPAAADEKEGGCELCAHHKAKAAAAKAEGAKADPKTAKGEAATPCACKKGDAGAKCECKPGACACQAKAGHGEAGHDCANCAHHGEHHGADKAPAKGETKI